MTIRPHLIEGGGSCRREIESKPFADRLIKHEAPAKQARRGGRYRYRTCGLFRVKEALYH